MAVSIRIGWCLYRYCTDTDCIVPALVHGVYAPGHCDFDIWPTDLKIKSNHLLAIANWNTKYGAPKLNWFQVIERAMLLFSRSLWPWPTDPKINRDFWWLMTNSFTNYGGHKPSKFQVIERTMILCSWSLWPCPMTYWPQNQNGSSTGHCHPWYQDMFT